MTFKVFVDGQEGTTGLSLLDYLDRRSDIDLLRIDEARRKDPGERARLLNEADLAFLCLPDVASREAVGLVENPRTRVIDASTAFRTDPAWTYGLPELAPGQRDAIRNSRRIANPGCHASAFILLVRPLVDAGLLPRSYPLSAFSLTGYSGGGKHLIARYQGAKDGLLASPRPYALAQAHKHLPEMHRQTGLDAPPAFNPVVGNFFKGLAVTVALQVDHLAGGASREKVHAALGAHYRDEAFVRVLPLDEESRLDGGFFDVQGCNDCNRADIFVFGNDQRLSLVARLDNLGKGAAGAAIQSMNILMGVAENSGLSDGL